MATRRLRHWKQQYNPNATFIWRRALSFAGVQTVPGEALSDETVKRMGPAKLRRFWESQAIELAEDVVATRAAANFGTPEPAPIPDPPAATEDAEISINDLGGSWYEVTVNGEQSKVRGKQAVEALTGRPFAPDDD